MFHPEVEVRESELVLGMLSERLDLMSCEKLDLMGNERLDLRNERLDLMGNERLDLMGNERRSVQAIWSELTWEYGWSVICKYLF